MTEITWNDAAPPKDDNENNAAWWLASVAQVVGITTVTADNVGEWLWRFAFVQEMAGRRWGEYENDVKRFATILARFRSATLSGRVGDNDREEFIDAHVAARVECCREAADGAVPSVEEACT